MRRVPLGLLGMVALIVGVEAVVSTKADRSARFEGWTWSHAEKAARGEATSSDVLCFGDSLVMMGVIPSLVGSEAGATVYNLAVPGGQATSSYYLLRRAIESGARPKAVVVDFMPSLLDCDITLNDARWHNVLDARDALDLAWASGEPARFASTVLPRWLPSLHARSMIRETVEGRMSGTRPSRRVRLDKQMGEDAKRRNLETNRGALVASEQIAPPSPDEIRRWYEEGYPRPWVCRPLQEEYVRRFLALAQSNGITVGWLIPPIHPDAKALEDAGGNAVRYARFVKEMASAYPNVMVLDARGSGFGREAFLDVIHLSRNGAIVLSGEIGRALATAEDGPRWVDLGQYREPSYVPIEDTEDSRRIVRKQTSDMSVMR